MSPLVSNIPIGFIANKVAEGMGMSGGIPGLSSTLTVGAAAEKINQARTAANIAIPYAKASAGLAQSAASDKAQQTRENLSSRFDNRLQRSFLRNNPEATAYDSNEDDDGEDTNKSGKSIYGNLKEKGNQRMLQILKRREKAVKDQIQKEVTRRTVQVASKISLRAVNTALGISIIGIIVVYIVWTIQLIAGNILNSETIPALDLGEKILWALLTGLLLTVFIGSLIIIAIIINPLSYLELTMKFGILRAVSIFLGIIGDTIGGIFK